MRRSLCTTVLLLSGCTAKLPPQQPQLHFPQYATLSPENQTIVRPAVERYVKDQLHQNWADLWEIQDTELTKEQFVKKMTQTMGVVEPRLQEFHLRSVVQQEDHFLVTGCGANQVQDTGIGGPVTFTLRMIGSRPRFSRFTVTLEYCG